MNEEHVIKKQLWKNIIYNLFAFTVIFTIFGIVIYNQVKVSIYSNAENELLRYQKTEINIRSDGMRTQVHGMTIINSGNPPPIITNAFDTQGLQVNRVIEDPKVIYLLRSADGEVLNRSSCGKNLCRLFN